MTGVQIARGDKATASFSATRGRRPRRWAALQPASVIGALIVVAFLGCALLGDWLAPYPYTAQRLNEVMQPPSASHWFGTDQLGRDVFSRIIVGARSVILQSFAATALSLLLGVSIGLIAGYEGGSVDESLMRLMDAILAFPALLLAMLAISMVGAGFFNLVVCMAVIFTPNVARVVRSVVLEIKTREFVEGARAIGAPTGRILWRHILPNASGPILVEGLLTISYAISLGAGLGFLGLGVQPPSPDWGLQVSEGRNFLLNAPWIAIFPALAISALVVGINLLADGLAIGNDARREVTNPDSSL